MSAPRTILLTGGTGFLGANLLKRLVDGGHEVILLTRPGSQARGIGEVLDKVTQYDTGEKSLKEIFSGRNVGTIIHCATDYGRRDSDLAAMVETNVVLPLRLLQLGERSGLSCFINTDTVLDKSVSPYALSKGQFGEWLRTYSDRIICVNIALEHFYGPGDDRSKFVSHIVRSILEDEVKIDLTAGEQRRDFIYIDDVVDAYLYIFKQSQSLKKGFYYYEVGTGKNTSIRELVSLVKELAGNKTTALNFGALPYRENEVMESKVDTSKVEELGWRPRHTLEEGLRLTIGLERELGKR